MKNFKIDNLKLRQVKDIIEKANALLEGEGKADNIEKEVELLEEKLKVITEKEDISISNFYKYWTYTDLETIAKEALIPEPKKVGLSYEEISKIILNISKGEYEECETNYCLRVLELETGLKNISDYIYWPNEIGLNLNASIGEIIEKIFIDSKL